jgi:hypothetical protein
LELLCIDTLTGSNGKRKIPGGGHDLGVAEPLPIINVEITVGLVEPDQTLHDESVGHQSLLSPIFGYE